MSSSLFGGGATPGRPSTTIIDLPGELITQIVHNTTKSDEAINVYRELSRRGLLNGGARRTDNYKLLNPLRANAMLWFTAKKELYNPNTFSIAICPAQLVNGLPNYQCLEDPGDYHSIRHLEIEIPFTFAEECRKMGFNATWGNEMKIHFKRVVAKYTELRSLTISMGHDPTCFDNGIYCEDDPYSFTLHGIHKLDVMASLTAAMHELMKFMSPMLRRKVLKLTQVGWDHGMAALPYTKVDGRQLGRCDFLRQLLDLPKSEVRAA